VNINYCLGWLRQERRHRDLTVTVQFRAAMAAVSAVA
jgi:hypothetical protein